MDEFFFFFFIFAQIFAATPTVSTNTARESSIYNTNTMNQLQWFWNSVIQWRGCCHKRWPDNAIRPALLFTSAKRSPSMQLPTQGTVISFPIVHCIIYIIICMCMMCLYICTIYVVYSTPWRCARAHSGNDSTMDKTFLNEQKLKASRTLKSSRVFGKIVPLFFTKFHQCVVYVRSFCQMR